MTMMITIPDRFLLLKVSKMFGSNGVVARAWLYTT